MARQEVRRSEDAPVRIKRDVDGIDLRLLERNVEILEARVREMRRSFIDAIPDLVQPHNGRRIHPLTSRKILGTRNLAGFFEELGKYADLKTTLGEDFEILQRYERLLAELQEMRSRTKSRVRRALKPSIQDHAASARIIQLPPKTSSASLARILPLHPIHADDDNTDELSATAGVKLCYIRLREIPEARLLAELSIRKLGAGLKGAMRSLKSRLSVLQNPDVEATLAQIKNPALFLRALAAHGVNLREAIGDRRMAYLETYERKRPERLLREGTRSIAETPHRAQGTAESSQAAPNYAALAARLTRAMDRLKPGLAQLVNPDAETALLQITNPAAFFRALESHGCNLQEILEPSVMVNLEAYRKAREARDLDSKPLTEGSRLDRAMDALALEEEREETLSGEETPDGEKHNTEPSLDHGKNGSYGEFLRFWSQMRQIKPFTPQEEHDLFEEYEDGKRNILDRLSHERQAMHALLALCVPRSLYREFSDNCNTWYGFQFFTSTSPDFEEFDPFKLLHGEEHRVDNTLTRWLELEVENSETVAESDVEEGDKDDEIIDFAVKWHEITRFIRQHGILYLKEFHRIEDMVARLKFRPQTVQRKGKNRYEEKTDPVGKALQRFVQSPSEKTLLQNIESLWLEASRAESNPEMLRGFLESFFGELQKIGVTVPNSTIPRMVLARLQAAEDPRRSIADLFMKLRPNPDLIKALAHFSSHEDELDKRGKTLLEIKQRILAPHLRNVCFSARFFIRRGAIPGVCIEAGTLGLMRAADLFDYRGGQRFYKYCWRSINETIKRGIHTENDQIHISYNQHESIRRVQKAARMSALQFGDESPKHVAKIAEMTEKEVTEVMEYARVNDTRSYETPDSDDSDARSLQDSLLTATTETPESILMQGELLRRSLEEILGKAGLSAREKDIVQKHYFDADDDNQTLKQIGDIHSVTRERIRQVEVKALAKLRRYMKRKNLSAESFS